MITISQLKKQYPQYEEIPDVELAEKLYDKYYSDKIDKNNFFEKVFPNISQSKIAERELKMIPEVDGIISPDDDLINQNLIQNQNFKPSTEDIAKQAGVGTQEGATPNARFAASLGYDENNKALAIKNVLSNLYNEDIEVRKGNKTGELEFFNPKTEKFELVNKPGVDLGDFTGLGGDAMVVIPDIAATIVGTVYSGGNIPAGVTAGALTAGVAEYSRYILGKKLYDINKDVTDEQLLNRALQAVGISAGSAVLGVGAAKIIKGVANLAKGRFVKGNEIADAKVENEIIKADQVAESINKTLDKAKINSNLKFTLAQASDDADLLAAQSAFENQNRLGYMNEFKTFNTNQAKSLNDYFGFLKSGFNTSFGKPVNDFEAGTLIQNVIRKNNDPLIKELKQKQINAENILEKEIIRLPDGSLKETGVSIRSSIDDVAQKYKNDVELAARRLDAAGETQSINSDVIRDAIKTLSTKEKNNLLKVNKISKIFKDDKTFKSIVKGETTIPISTVRNTLSKLSEDIRNIATGSVTGETPNVGSLKFLKSAIDKQLRKDASSTYINEFDNFNTLVKENKNKLNNELLERITLKKNNRLVFGDEDIFALSFKKGLKSKEYADSLHNVIKDSPDAMTAFKNSIYDKYKVDVIKNGKLNQNAHNNFIKSYEAPLKTFFSNNEFSRLQKLGGFQKVVEDATELRNNTVKEIARSFEGKLEKLTPGELVNKIYKPNNINEILQLKKILKNDPEVYKAFQRSVLRDMNESVTKMSDSLGMRVIDPKSFDNYLNGAGNERGYRVALREIFDTKFLDNLNLLNKALTISGRKVSSRTEGVVGSALTDIIRARLGQFTFAGRLFTASRRIYKKAAERIMKNALLDPESLNDLIKLRKLKSSTKEGIVILSKLGGSIFIDEREDNFTPFTTLKNMIGQE